MSRSSNAVAVTPSLAARDVRRVLAVSLIRNDVLAATVTSLALKRAYRSVAHMNYSADRQAPPGVRQRGRTGHREASWLWTVRSGFLGSLTFVAFVAACQAVTGLPGTGLAALAFVVIGNAVSGGTVPFAFLPDGFRQDP